MDRTTMDATRAAWQRHIEAWQESGLSQRAYCAGKGITEFSFSYWKRKLRGRQADGNRMVEVRPGSQVISGTRPPLLEMSVDGEWNVMFRLHFPGNLLLRGFF